MTTDLRTEFRKPSYLSHLILESDREKLAEAVAQENWDIENVNVRLFLDEVEVRNEQLEPILKDWANRLYKQKADNAEKQLKDTQEWIKVMQDKEELEYEINKRVKEKLQKMIEK